MIGAALGALLISISIGSALSFYGVYKGGEIGSKAVIPIITGVVMFWYGIHFFVSGVFGWKI